MEPRSNVPLDVRRDLLGILGVVEVSGLILEVQAIPAGRAREAGTAIVDEGNAGHGRTRVDGILHVGRVASCPAAVRLRQRSGLEHAIRTEDQRPGAGGRAQDRRAPRIEARRSEVRAIRYRWAGALSHLLW